MPNKIFVVSDSTGDTAEKVVSAALKQFETEQVEIEIFSRVRSEELIEEIVERATDEDVLIVHTIVDPEQRQTLQSMCSEADLDDLDLIGPLMGPSCRRGYI